jgi:hypothetical protein
MASTQRHRTGRRRLRGETRRPRWRLPSRYPSATFHLLGIDFVPRLIRLTFCVAGASTWVT